MNIKLKIRFSVVLLFLLYLCVHSYVAEASNFDLKIALATDTLTWDSHNYRAGIDPTIHNFVYDTLVTLDKDNNPLPRLAVAWKQLDSKSWEFVLREGVKFNDGTPFNAEVAKYNLERCAKAPRGSGFAGVIDNVQIMDEYKIKVNLKYPYSGLLNNLASPVISMLSPNAIKKAGKSFNSAKPVGTGQYELIEWIPNNRVVLKSKQDYWGVKTPFETIMFRIIPEESTRLMALKNKEVHLIENVPPHEAVLLETSDDLQLLKMPRGRSVWLGMNVTYGPLQDIKVREAISLAINKDDIVKFILENMAITANTFIPECIQKGLATYPSVVDIKRAKELLAEAGYANGFDITLTTPEARYLRDKQVSEVIQQQLKKIGINVQVNVMEWGSFLSSLGRHEGQLFLVGWGFMTGAEPTQALRQTMETGNAFNYSNYSNKDFDNLLSELEAESEKNKRIELMNQINQMLIVQDRVIIPLYHMYSIYGAVKELKGVFLSPMELIDLSEAKLQ